ncbi:hypothetical protein IQ276_008560 [Desmonostoc muscorum LEGE 12446]|uniref:Uncharacterized protein n=1 Tax=Desmonostoc muscorum LEGE 12446 TaxID=1828758 RepID=A0A8J7DE98_DESMC|nr:hypothetical protein [Desmonostoc muscorum]MCF2146500.1 hypothetical protein [Desmonostoc muscorum LEGE 12446]
MFNNQTTAFQAQHSIKSVQSTNPQYQVDVTPVLLQQPFSPFAIALSISIVLGAIAGFIKTLKSVNKNQ